MGNQRRFLPHTLTLLIVLILSWASPVRGEDPRRSDVEREALRKQVIYLVLTDRFFNGDPTNDNREHAGENDPSRKDLTKFHGGDVVGVRKKLGYLQGLGVNTIWITPVYKQVAMLKSANKVGMAGYHGYWPDFTDPDDAAMDARFGTKDELKDLIAGLHEAKMRFVLDKVVNHAGYGARVTREHPAWFHPDRPDCHDIVECPLSGLPDFKQEDKAVADFLTRMSRRWVKDFALDGVRMDTAKHVPLSYFQKRWVPVVRTEKAKLFLLAEVTPGDGEYASVGCLKKFLEAGFDSAFNFWLRNELVASIGKGGSLDGVAAVIEETRKKLGEERALLLCNLLDNHDLRRFTNEPGLEVPEREIQRRYQAALILLFTLPGIPQLYSGDEIGMYGEHNDNAANDLNRRSMPEWAWTADGRKLPRDKRDPEEPRLCLPEPDVAFNWCHDLIAIRKANRALHSGYYAELWRPNGKQNAYAFFRGAEDNRVIVVVNESEQAFDTKGIALRSNDNLREADKKAFTEGAVWERLFDQNSAPKTLVVSGGNLQGILPARSIGIYRLP